MAADKHPSNLASSFLRELALALTTTILIFQSVWAIDLISISQGDPCSLSVGLCPL